MPRSICLSAAAVLVAAAAVGVAGAGLKPPTLSVSNASAAQDAGRIVFTVRLTRRAAKRVTVRYATADGSATAGSDYLAVHRTLVFKPGQRLRRISVPLVESTVAEDDETFSVILSHPTNARIAGSQAEGKILAHDLPAPFKARATLTAPSLTRATGVFTMTLDAGKGEMSFALTLAGLPENPGLAHIHSVTDSLLGVNIVPLPSKDGSVTGTLVLARKLIIAIHENPGNYFVDVHGPTFAWALHGALALVAD
jgi:hypothetical protein